MKNRVKIFTFILVLALALSIAIGFSVSAENAESEGPKVVAKNTKTNGNFCLMFALDPATCGDTITFEAYNTNTKETANAEDLIESFTVNKADVLNNEQKIDVNNDGEFYDEVVLIQSYKGVSAKDIADTWHVYFTSNGNTTHVEYSVKDYAFERLYEDFVILASDTSKKDYRQKGFYLSILEIGSKAQDLLVNWDKEANGEEPERLANEYTYASVLGGTFNGGTAASYVEIGDILTLTASETNKETSWVISTYDTNGNLVDNPESIDIVDGTATVTVKGNTVIVPGHAKGLTPGKYFDDIGDTRFSYDELTSLSGTGIGGYDITLSDGTKVKSFSLTAVDGHGNVLQHVKPENYSSGKNRVWFTNSDYKNSGNCLVIETDIYYDVTATLANVGDEYVGDGNAWGSGIKWRIYNSDSNIPVSFQNYMLDYSGNMSSENKVGGTDWIMSWTDEEFSEPMKMKSWYNLCLEIYNEGYIRTFIDGKLISEQTFTPVETNLPTEQQWIEILTESVVNKSTIYFDNTYIGVVEKDYVAAE